MKLCLCYPKSGDKSQIRMVLLKGGQRMDGKVLLLLLFTACNQYTKHSEYFIDIFLDSSLCDSNENVIIAGKVEC